MGYIGLVVFLCAPRGWAQGVDPNGPGVSPARVIYVDDDAVGPGGPGTSWQNAFKSLQHALAVALYGDEIRVAQGVYKPDQDEFGFVREAAVGALRRLTGQNFGYDHAGTPEVRRRGYKAWKAWWDEKGAEFLAQAPS